MLESFKESIFDKNQDFPWQSFEGETLIIDPRNNQSYELNELGTFIWQKIDGTKTLRQILDAILDEYEADPEDVMADLNQLIELLSEADLIQEGAL